MSKQFEALTRDISASVKEIGSGVPDIMAAFSSLSKAATKDGALDARTKELIALSIGIATHCEGCIGFHTRTLVKMGVSREQVLEALGVAIYMGGGPSLMYAADAIRAFDQFTEARGARA